MINIIMDKKPDKIEFLTLDFNNYKRVRDYNNERMKRINKQIKKQKTNNNKKPIELNK